MMHFSKTLPSLLCTGAIILLTACSTTIEEPTELVEMTAKEAAALEAATITGSRIPRKSTERLLRTTDAAGSKEMMSTGRPPEQGALKSN